MFGLIVIGYWANTYEFGASEPLARTENRRTDYEPECSKRKDADLCAQMRVAKSAEDQASINELGLWLLGLTLVFTAVAAVATTVSAMIASSTARRQLRAYVKFADDKLDKTNLSLDALSVPEVTINIYNVGNTPARNAVVRLAFAVAEFPLSSTLPNERVDSNRSRMVVFPHDGFNYTAKMERQLTAKESSCIKKADATTRLYLYGRVDYSDAFGVNRWTTFRTVSTYVGGQPGFTGCAEGNDYF